MTDHGDTESAEYRGRTVQDTLAEAGDALVETVKSIAGPPLARLVGRFIRRMRFHAAGYCLALLAVIWAAIALTLAAAQHLPLWASFSCVSAILAVWAACAFIIPSLENGDSKSGRTSNLEGDDRHG